MIIGVDLDSVLNNLMDEWLADYNREWEDTLTPEDMKSWDCWKYVRSGCGKHIYDYLTPELFKRTRPTEGSREVTRELIDAGHTLVIVTAVTPGTYDAKRNWVAKYFPHIKHMIATNHKWFVGADVLIDDGVHNLESFLPRRSICFNQPWNQSWTGERVRNWNDIRELFKGE